jgi:hypothetical protein
MVSISAVFFGGADWIAGIINLKAIRLDNNEIGARTVDLQDIVYGECEVSYARSDRELLGYAQATVPIFTEARRHGWKPTNSFDGNISFSLNEMIGKNLDAEELNLDLNSIRVIRQHSGQLHGYIDIPIGLARSADRRSDRYLINILRESSG